MFLSRIQIFHPGSKFFHPGSRVKKAPGDQDPQQRIKVYNPMKLSSRKYDSECLFRIPDPRSGIFPSRIPGLRKHRIPDLQHWFKCLGEGLGNRGLQSLRQLQKNMNERWIQSGSGICILCNVEH